MPNSLTLAHFNLGAKAPTTNARKNAYYSRTQKCATTNLGAKAATHLGKAPATHARQNALLQTHTKMRYYKL